MQETRNDVDQEWVALMNEAKKLGISKEEVRYFIEMNNLNKKPS
ncbi:anti-repressor SinI family protein [Bacillaceae bacterium S4-13-58]